ncbi:MAG: glycosyl hydrolase, repeat protein [Myxococcaceae bacterium]|nr:glycosyl hydrolase, repeat protein [Myxococcaceae bacterium]
MSERFFVSTRKGLFSYVRNGKGWTQERVSFLGDAVSIALHDKRDGDSGTLYAGLGLGHFGVKLRRSSDLGATWQDVAAPTFPPMPEGHVETLADGKPWPWRVDQIWALEAGATVGELWCGSIGGGLFRSRDRGTSWDFVRSLWDHPKRKEWFGGGADMPGIHSICLHPTDPRSLLLGVSCGGAWRTSDDGATWELSADGMFADYMPPPRRGDPAVQDPHRIVQCRSAPQRLWCQHHNGVFRSDDGGRNWNEIANVKPAVFGFAVAVHPNDPDTAWLVPAVKDETRIPVDAKVVVSRTRDAGKTWEVLDRGLPPPPAYDIAFRHALDVDEKGESLAFGSSTGSLWVSDTAGDAWTCLSSNLPQIYAVRFA